MNDSQENNLDIRKDKQTLFSKFNSIIKKYTPQIIVGVIISLISAIIIGLTIHAPSSSSVNKTSNSKTSDNKIYTIQSSIYAPLVEVYPYKENIKPGEIITIKAHDQDGIYDIGYAWDGDLTSSVHNQSIIKIVAPTEPGIHTLFFYSRDNSTKYNLTGYTTLKYNIKP